MFDAALKRAVSDGDIIQVKDTYKLSPGCKNRREDALMRTMQKKQDDMEKKLSEQSESTRMECAEILFDYLDDESTVKKETCGCKAKVASK